MYFDTNFALTLLFQSYLLRLGLLGMFLGSKYLQKQGVWKPRVISLCWDENLGGAFHPTLFVKSRFLFSQIPAEEPTKKKRGEKKTKKKTTTGAGSEQNQQWWGDLVIQGVGCVSYIRLLYTAVGKG